MLFLQWELKPMDLYDKLKRGIEAAHFLSFDRGGSRTSMFWLKHAKKKKERKRKIAIFVGILRKLWRGYNLCSFGYDVQIRTCLVTQKKCILPTILYTHKCLYSIHPFVHFLLLIQVQVAKAKTHPPQPPPPALLTGYRVISKPSREI